MTTPEHFSTTCSSKQTDRRTANNEIDFIVANAPKSHFKRWLLKMMRHGCIVRTLKIAAGVVLILAALMYLQRKDYPPRRAHQARDMVRAEFGSGYPTSNEFCIVFGFLQGCTCYYRFDTTPEAAQIYIKNKGLISVTDRQAIRVFTRSSPYWWEPEKGTKIEFFGYGSRTCTFSFDRSTGRCHVLLHGG